jgi:hypothetical protein
LYAVIGVFPAKLTMISRGVTSPLKGTFFAITPVPLEEKFQALSSA